MSTVPMPQEMNIDELVKILAEIQKDFESLLGTSPS